MLIKHVVQLIAEFRDWDGSYKTPPNMKVFVYNKDSEIILEVDVLPYQTGKFRYDLPLPTDWSGPFYYQFKGGADLDLVETSETKVPTADTPEDRAVLQALIDDFRLRIGDDDSDKNILLKKIHRYTNNKIAEYIHSAVKDINRGSPRTVFTVYQFGRREDPSLLVEGAMIFALMAEGFLQLRNQVDYSDSGLSIAMFNKTGMYQNWAGFMLQQYMLNKKEFKTSVIPRSHNSGFVGISSEFGYRHY